MAKKIDPQKHLAKSDPILAAVIKKVAQLEHAWNPRGAPRPNHFKALVVAIINQQLSGKAADTIQKRFEVLFAKGSRSKKFPKPEDVLKMPTARMRKVGLSGMKVSFMKDLSRKALDGTVDFRAMKKM